MSRRETFLESARAANDRIRPSMEAPLSESPRTVVDLSPITSRLDEMQRQLEAIESKFPAPANRGVPARWRVALPWVLATVLVTVLAITAVRPDWALRPRQRAELLLGTRLYQHLEHMGDSDRLQVLKALWSVAPQWRAKTD